MVRGFESLYSDKNNSGNARVDEVTGLGNQCGHKGSVYQGFEPLLPDRVRSFLATERVLWTSFSLEYYKELVKLGSALTLEG